jgi:hypothetical protein
MKQVILSEDVCKLVVKSVVLTDKPLTIVRNLILQVEKYNISGSSKKEIVINSVNLVLSLLPEPQKSELVAIISIIDVIIDELVLLYNLGKKLKLFKCCHGR